MLKANFKRVEKLIDQVEKFTAIVDKLTGPVKVVIRTMPTEGSGSEVIFDITAENDDIRPFVFNKSQNMIDAIITHYNTRITEAEAEILTL